jgi:hypothetical protein
MVVDNSDLVSVSVLPDEYDAPLFIDADRVELLQIALQSRGGSTAAPQPPYASTPDKPRSTNYISVA